MPGGISLVPRIELDPAPMLGANLNVQSHNISYAQFSTTLTVTVEAGEYSIYITQQILIGPNMGPDAGFVRWGTVGNHPIDGLLIGTWAEAYPVRIGGNHLQLANAIGTGTTPIKSVVCSVPSVILQAIDSQSAPLLKTLDTNGNTLSYIDVDGSIVLSDTANGHKYRIHVTNGTLVLTQIS
jgi:hypothetical protein